MTPLPNGSGKLGDLRISWSYEEEYLRIDPKIGTQFGTGSGTDRLKYAYWESPNVKTDLNPTFDGLGFPEGNPTPPFSKVGNFFPNTGPPYDYAVLDFKTVDFKLNYVYVAIAW
jgi:hypothetical protein